MFVVADGTVLEVLKHDLANSIPSTYGRGDELGV